MAEQRTKDRKLQTLAVKIRKAREEGGFVDSGEDCVKAVTCLGDVDKVHGMLAEGSEVVGYKVGLNLPEGSFRSLGLAEPFTAPVLKGWVKGDGEEVSAQYATKPGTAEAEWGFIIARDLPSTEPLPDLDQVAAATSHICLCIEIAATCIQGPAPTTLLQKLADHGLCTNIIVKPLLPTNTLLDTETGLDVLSQQEVTLAINGKPVAPPAKADPLKELHRLIRLVHSKGQSLSKGDLVITGAVVKHVGLRPGDHIAASFQNPEGKDIETVKCTISGEKKKKRKSKL